MKKRLNLAGLMAIILVLCMLVGTFAGCKTEGEDATEVVTEPGKTDEKMEDEELEPLTVTMLYSDNATYQYNPDWLILEEIYKATGVTLELIPVPESDWDTKRTTVINSGDMPDIISKTLPGQISEYAINGLFVPISDYMDQMPNFSAFVEEYNYGPDLDLQREVDGKFYFLPVCSNETRLNNMNWLIRKDLLDEFELEIPKTMDDVLEVARVFKEAYPDVYPITNRFGWGNMTTTIARAFGVPGGWQLDAHGFYLDTETDEYVFAPATEGYKEFLMFMNTLYEEELLDPEYLTLDSNVYEQRVANDQNLIMCDWVGNDVRYNDWGREINPDFNVVTMVPPTGPNGDYAIGHTALYTQGWVIPASTAERDDFDRILEFIDWFYTDEAALITSFGVEGVSFEYADNGSVVWLDPNNNNNESYGVYNNCLTPRYHADVQTADWPEYSRTVYQEMAELGVVPPVLPGVKMTADEQEYANQYISALSDYRWTQAAKFVNGEISFDEYDAFLEECEDKGAAELREHFNTIWGNQK